MKIRARGIAAHEVELPLPSVDARDFAPQRAWWPNLARQMADLSNWELTTGPHRRCAGQSLVCVLLRHQPEDDPMSEFDPDRRQLLKVSAATGGAVAAAPFVPGGTSMAAAESTGGSPAPTNVVLRVNGREHGLTLDPRTTLLDALREHLQLTGSKKGCGLGQCGACTVLMDGKRVKSCLWLAALAEGREITTIEGLAHGDQLHPLQAAFIERDAFQCGYCTSGQIVSGVACIAEGHAGSAQEIREWMSGNLCRCGAYDHIVAAIRDVAGGSGEKA
jgi:xanthine dehydrogenase YagT iron-sulfur-binding subunit